MRNLILLSLLFLGYGDPVRDTTDTVTVEIQITQASLDIQHDMDTIKIMIKQLKDALNKANGDTIVDGVYEDFLRP